MRKERKRNATWLILSLIAVGILVLVVIVYGGNKPACPAGQTWVQIGTINGVPEWGCV